MLIFPLKKEWYEKIRSGEKRIEYREMKDYWKRRLWNAHCLPNLNPFVWDCTKDWSAEKVPCILQLGYDPRFRLSAHIVKVEAYIDGKDTELRIDRPVYAIHLADVKEAESPAFQPRIPRQGGRPMHTSNPQTHSIYHRHKKSQPVPEKKMRTLEWVIEKRESPRTSRQKNYIYKEKIMANDGRCKETYEKESFNYLVNLIDAQIRAAVSDARTADGVEICHLNKIRDKILQYCRFETNEDGRPCAKITFFPSELSSLFHYFVFFRVPFRDDSDIQTDYFTQLHNEWVGGHSDPNYYTKYRIRHFSPEGYFKLNGRRCDELLEKKGRVVLKAAGITTAGLSLSVSDVLSGCFVLKKDMATKSYDYDIRMTEDGWEIVETIAYKRRGEQARRSYSLNMRTLETEVSEEERRPLEPDN